VTLPVQQVGGVAVGADAGAPAAQRLDQEAASEAAVDGDDSDVSMMDSDGGDMSDDPDGDAAASLSGDGGEGNRAETEVVHDERGARNDGTDSIASAGATSSAVVGAPVGSRVDDSAAGTVLRRSSCGKRPNRRYSADTRHLGLTLM
jgi:hypothetical protein